VPRERTSAADNWRGLRDPLLATAAAILFGAACYAFEFSSGARCHGWPVAPDYRNGRGEGGGRVDHPRPVAG
jgi:hypothetical protein